MKKVSYREEYSSDEEDDGAGDLSDSQRELFALCQCGYRERAIKLLNQGVNPNFFIRGEAPLHVAAKGNHVGVIAALLIAPLGHVAINSGVGVNDEEDADTIEVIANHRQKAVATTRDTRYGWTALHYAVSMANLEALSLMAYLSPKEVFSVKDRSGRSALQLAQEMVMTRKENSSSLLYPYLPQRGSDLALSILSDFCSDRPSEDGRLSRSIISSALTIIIIIIIIIVIIICVVHSYLLLLSFKLK